MGIKSRKRMRKDVEFYCSTFGFREPIKVLVDGNFLHLLRETQGNDVEYAIGKAINCRVAAFTTKCVSHELQEMGKDVVDTLHACRGLKLHKCEHAEPLSASECLLEQVGTMNNDHWWVATQDERVHQSLKKLPNAPVFRMSINGVVLQTPSKKSKLCREKAVTELMHISSWEKDAEVMQELKFNERRRTASGKKRKAKGPNPLSCKKKKTAGPIVKESSKAKGSKRPRRKSKAVSTSE